MPFFLPPKNIGAGAPQVEDGLALVRFDDLRLKEKMFQPGTDIYGHEDSGNRFVFSFTLLDEDGAVAYDEGDPIELEAVTREATGERSNFFALLSKMLTPAELAAYNDATADNPFDGSVLIGRVLHATIAHNKKEWPFIESIVGIAKKKGAAK